MEWNDDDESFFATSLSANTNKFIRLNSSDSEESCSNADAINSSSIANSSIQPNDIGTRQNLSIRAKKHIAPVLFSRRKFIMSAMNPVSAAALDDIHYLLKAHIFPKEKFLSLDAAMRKMLIKLVVVAHEVKFFPAEVAALRHIEASTRQFIVNFTSFSLDKRHYDPSPLISALEIMRLALLTLAKSLFSEKSKSRIDLIFTELSQKSLWDAIFSSHATAEQIGLLKKLAQSFEIVLSLMPK